MAGYRLIVVGTDGSESSLRAVDRAAEIAGDSGARLVIACAYEPLPREVVREASIALREEAFHVVGSAPAQDTLQTAQARADRSGSANVATRAVRESPEKALLDAVVSVFGGGRAWQQEGPFRPGQPRTRVSPSGETSTGTVSPSRTCPANSSLASWSPMACCTNRRSGRAP